MLNSAQTLNLIAKGLTENGGTFVLAYHPERQAWSAAIEWGEEDESSDMVGAAAYGTSQKAPAEAVQQALEESGWIKAYPEAASI